MARWWLAAPSKNSRRHSPIMRSRPRVLGYIDTSHRPDPSAREKDFARAHPRSRGRTPAGTENPLSWGRVILPFLLDLPVTLT